MKKSHICNQFSISVIVNMQKKKKIEPTTSSPFHKNKTAAPLLQAHLKISDPNFGQLGLQPPQPTWYSHLIICMGINFHSPGELYSTEF